MNDLKAVIIVCRQNSVIPLISINIVYPQILCSRSIVFRPRGETLHDRKDRGPVSPHIDKTCHSYWTMCRLGLDESGRIRRARTVFGDRLLTIRRGHYLEQSFAAPLTVSSTNLRASSLEISLEPSGEEMLSDVIVLIADAALFSLAWPFMS